MPNIQIDGRDAETLTGYATNYVDAEGNKSPIKIPTFNSWVEKARKEGWLKPALNAGGAYFYFTEDLAKLPGLYGRKQKAPAIHPEQHEIVVKDNIRLSAENVQYGEAIDHLNEYIERLLDRIELLEASYADVREDLDKANSYITKIESPVNV